MAGKTAVVCDDDRTMSRIVQHILAKAGFEVFSADNGQDGLGLIRSKKPALVLLDLEMPVKDGLEVLKDLKSEGASDSYIIVLSAHESAAKHAEVRAFGAKDIIIKPFNPATLVQIIQGLVQQGKV